MIAGIIILGLYSSLVWMMVFKKYQTQKCVIEEAHRAAEDMRRLKEKCEKDNIERQKKGEELKDCDQFNDEFFENINEDNALRSVGEIKVWAKMKFDFEKEEPFWVKKRIYHSKVILETCGIKY
jgi:hypothetical protein